MTEPRPARIAVTGASGLIGSALVARLAGRGDHVLRLVRRPPAAPDEVTWDPAAGTLDRDALIAGGPLDAVVHLAGAGVGDHRWTPAYKRQILDSRVQGTRTVVAALSELGMPVRLVSASAVGFYGDRGDRLLTEEATPGTGFLADVVAAWEAEALAAPAPIAVACARTGLVVAPRGGAFAPMLRLTRLGLGGPLGSGRQYWPWISLVDEVRALTFLLDHPEIAGPVNLTGPGPVRQRDLATALGAVLHRPALLPAPRFALRLVLGEFAGDVLASQRAVPDRLLAAGFRHEHHDVEAAMRYLAGRG